MTTAFIIVISAVIIIYDIFAVLTGGMENTISYRLHEWAKKYPIIPFVAGALCGHFWFGVCG